VTVELKLRHLEEEVDTTTLGAVARAMVEDLKKFLQK